jgi:exopolyphosphatase/pppGpp-phosphohydrolase
MHYRRPRADRQVVAVEGYVELAKWYSRVEQLAGKRVEAACQYGTSPVDADERDAGAGTTLKRIFLDDLVSDPHQCAAHSLTVEDNCDISRQPSTFLASLDRVKGAKNSSGSLAAPRTESEVQLLRQVGALQR